MSEWNDQLNGIEITIEKRVAHAYHNYARFCSAHPNSCLAISCIMMLLLSYPAIARFRLPVSSPLDVRSSSALPPLQMNGIPVWMNAPPAFYVQQIHIRSVVSPWFSNLTAQQAVRGSLSLTFGIYDVLRSLPALQRTCLLVAQSPPSPLLPAHGCLILSPSAFWNHDMTVFEKDSCVVSTVFSVSSSHVLEAFLGMPPSVAGIKEAYNTNRQRTIDVALTVFLSSVPDSLYSLSSVFSSNFTVHSSPQDSFLHVFFRPRKHLTDYAPLVLSYVAFMLYVYFSASKIEMVSSRWGLALSAGGSVSFSLLMTAGIAAHFGLGPAIWGGEIFPYLALFLGLENILCITRSVAYTPPSLDVSSRLSQGLSSEGYSLSKYFLIELALLAGGFISLPVPELREFCTFASIGLVVDFYMQLFFYAPCLTFDLECLTEEEKRNFSRLLFSAHVPPLRSFPPVSCPMRSVWPRLFSPTLRIRKVNSEPRLLENITDETSSVSKGHRRTSSAYKVGGEVNVRERRPPPQSLSNLSSLLKSNTAHSSPQKRESTRLRLLSFVSRTRIFQRSFITIFFLWVVWLAVILHWNRESDQFPLLEEKGAHWQRQGLSAWPFLLSEYNITLSDRYITFLPPVYLSAIRSHQLAGDAAENLPGALSHFALLCCPSFRSLCLLLGRVHEAYGNRNALDWCWEEKFHWRSWWFFHHLSSLSPPNNQPSCFVPNKLANLFEKFVGRDPIRRLGNRNRPRDSKSISQVWTMAAYDSSLLFLGCSDGSVEVVAAQDAVLFGLLQSSNEAVTTLLAQPSLLLIGRVDGTLELASFAARMDSMAFTSCEENNIYAWKLSNGELAWSAERAASGSLALSPSLLVSTDPHRRIHLRLKTSGKLVDTLTEDDVSIEECASHVLLSVSPSIVALSIGSSLTFWELDRKALIGKVEVGSVVKSLHLLSSSSVLALSHDRLHLIHVPRAKFQ